jgi:glycosyltransferase involved in cell wall biosynthesis
VVGSPSPRNAESRPMPNRLRIDVAVHGRFHAFHLARALLARGHDVRLLTNYPASVVERFGFPRCRTVTHVAHGIAARIYHSVPQSLRIVGLEAALHQWFGRWVRSKVRNSADIIYVFSSISEETLKSFYGAAGPQVWVARGSSHIRVQRKLLEEEELRTGVRLEKPSPWMISREEREYGMAQRVITLSSFAKHSFAGQPVPSDKVTLLLSAVDIARFRPDPVAIQSRLQRIRSGDSLHVLTVGAFSMRKGAYDLLEIARRLAGRMSFRFVGDLPQEALALKAQAGSAIEFFRRVPEFELKQHYSWGDIFLFPTIEDGFAAVLTQALAAGLPVLATPNSSAPDIVRRGETGWILPIRSPSMFVDQLKWCDAHRSELHSMVQNCSGYTLRDWSDMALEVEEIYAAGQEMGKARTAV